MADPTEKMIRLLESATTGSPELSKDTLLALGWRWECIGCPGGGMWKDSLQTFHCGPLPLVSEKVEAARALIPDNHFIAAQEESQGYWMVRVYAHPLTNESDYEDPLVTSHARTLPLTLCSAAIKLSLLFQEKSDDNTCL
jgi:hypothetical protein